MSIFELFKKKKPTQGKEPSTETKAEIHVEFGHENDGRNVYVIGEGIIPEDERKYYNPDDYYKNYAYNGLVGEEIVPFEHQKKFQTPSRRGLYPAEIMLLQYCTYGSYPYPRNGFPGLWWYKYGIRDVIGYLGSLELKGFITRSTPAESLEKYYIPELKEILSNHGQDTKGKKNELIQRILGCVDYDELRTEVTRFYYKLTPKGWDELLNNGQLVLDANGIGEILSPRIDKEAIILHRLE